MPTRLILLLVLSTCLLLGLAMPAFAQQVADRFDCSDFDTQEEPGPCSTGTPATPTGWTKTTTM